MSHTKIIFKNHKSRCWVHIRDEGGIVLETTIVRDLGGLEALVKLYEKHEVEKVVMESTSTYWIPIYRRLEKQLECCVINAYQRKVLGKTQD